MRVRRKSAVKIFGKQRNDELPEAGGGFVLLSFNSMYASLRGLFKHWITGWILNDGW